MNKLQTKTLATLATVMLLSIVVIAFANLASFRNFSVQAATEQTRTAAEMISVTLTEAMLNGTIDRRDALLARLGQVEGLDEVRAVRSSYLEPRPWDTLPPEHLPDALEYQVLKTGQSIFVLEYDAQTPKFRATIPYIAERNETIDCLACHLVPEGTVLGAVTLKVSIENMRRVALLTVAGLVGAVVFFALMSLLFLRRLLNPLLATAKEIGNAVMLANQGDFSARVQARSRDEIGAIAEHFNSLSEGIVKRLSAIRHNVAQLVQTQPEVDTRGDLLADTAETVAGLVRVAQFKQAIEEDETIEEVFQRISEVIITEFRFQSFSIYEVDHNRRQTRTIIVDGLAQVPIRWCSEDIKENCNACRVVRTGHVIDGTENSLICRSFSRDALADDKYYFCFPIIQSGGVGSVIQLVLDREERSRAHAIKPLLESYLREAAPVLQAKRLMASLRESTLNDAMTGLRNRRFLEEYSDKLIAQCKRRDTPITLVMLDLDYFKTVNDTYGHDVGDSILTELAKIFMANVRDADWVIRYGGEEFLIILLDTSAEQGMQVAEKIRAAVEDHSFNVNGTKLNKTISAGLADYPNDGQAFWQVLKYADVALYAAKEGGRNRVVHFTSDLWEGNEKY